MAARVTVVQNGEIYNYIELRDALVRAGRTFRTSSDTEVVAALYARARRGGVRTDARDVRDRHLGRAAPPPRAGARSRRQEAALLHADWRLLSVRVRAESAACGACRACPTSRCPRCSSSSRSATWRVSGAIFSGMSRLEPGATLVLEPPNAPRVVRYWTWPSSSLMEIPEPEYLERLGAELDEAVRIRLRSDVPLGAFLSGGLDSAAVLALMARHSPGRSRRSRSGSAIPSTTSWTAARATARAFGADHHEWQVAPDCVQVAEQAGGLLRRAVCGCVGDSDLLRRGAREAARDRLSDRRRRRRALRRLPAVRAGARPLDERGQPRGCAALVGLGARWMPAHARGKGRLDTLALGPEAWFVWRRTVFPDYLLRADCRHRK